MKLFIISDVHGRSNWQHFVDIRHLIKLPNLETDYDKYIFLGDYVDSYTETDAVILYNLQQIIQFKKNYPDNVILLLGNHDLQYMFEFNNHGCSGYRPEMYQELHKLFQDNKELFQPVYRINNYLFTHAGVTTIWKKYLNETTDGTTYEGDIDQIINTMFDSYDYYLFIVGYARGGHHKSGGPFWADKSESSAWVLPNYHQVVGHHPVKDAPYTHKVDDNTSITYVDNNETGILELEI